MIELFALSSGRMKYEYSPWKHNQNDKIANFHFAPGDMLSDHQVDPIDPRTDVACLIDCDYYVQDWALLLKKGVPTIMYTFLPQVVAGLDGDCSFSIKDDVVTYNVSGGGSWQHPVWAWGRYGEFFSVT